MYNTLITTCLKLNWPITGPHYCLSNIRSKHEEFQLFQRYYSMRTFVSHFLWLFTKKMMMTTISFLLAMTNWTLIIDHQDEYSFLFLFLFFYSSLGSNYFDADMSWQNVLGWLHKVHMLDYISWTDEWLVKNWEME